MKAIALRVSAVVASLLALNSCAHGRKEFWTGRIDPAATLSYFSYQTKKVQMDGISYTNLVELIGPGNFSGPTANGDGYIFTWRAPVQTDGALMVVCDTRGKVVQHDYVTP